MILSEIECGLIRLCMIITMNTTYQLEDSICASVQSKTFSHSCGQQLFLDPAAAVAWLPYCPCRNFWRMQVTTKLSDKTLWQGINSRISCWVLCCADIKHFMSNLSDLTYNILQTSFNALIRIQRSAMHCHGYVFHLVSRFFDTLSHTGTS